jgi:DNA-binding PadR family transcriptional regulator
MHGYQVAEYIERDLSTCTDLKKSTAYFLLDKMAGRGWVTFHEEQAGNRPQRRIYQITEQGNAAFQRLLRENLARYRPQTFGGDVGIAFVDTLAPAEAAHLLRERRQALLERLGRYRSVPEHTGASQLLIEHQIHHMESEAGWLESLIHQLESRDPDGVAPPDRDDNRFMQPPQNS